MLAPFVAVNIIANCASFRVTGDLYEFQIAQAVTTLAQSCAASDKQCTEVLHSVLEHVFSSSSSSSSSSSPSTAAAAATSLAHLVVVLAMGAETVLESSLPDELRSKKSAIVLSCAANTQRVFFPLATAMLVTKQIIVGGGAAANQCAVPATTAAAKLYRESRQRALGFIDDVAQLLGEMVHAAEAHKEAQKNKKSNVADVDPGAPVVSATAVFRLCVPAQIMCNVLSNVSAQMIGNTTAVFCPPEQHLLVLRLAKLAAMFVFLSSSFSDSSQQKQQHDHHVLDALVEPLKSLSEATFASAKHLTDFLVCAMRRGAGLRSTNPGGEQHHLSRFALQFISSELQQLTAASSSPLVLASFVYRVSSAILSEFAVSDGTASSSFSIKPFLKSWKEAVRKEQQQQSSSSASAAVPVLGMTQPAQSALALDALRISLRGPEDAMIRAVVFSNISSSSSSSSSATATATEESAEEEVASVLMLLLNREHQHQQQQQAKLPHRTNIQLLLLCLIRCLGGPTLGVPQIENVINVMGSDLRLEKEEAGAAIIELVAQTISVAALFRPQLIVPVIFSSTSSSSSSSSSSQRRKAQQQQLIYATLGFMQQEVVAAQQEGAAASWAAAGATQKRQQLLERVAIEWISWLQRNNNSADATGAMIGSDDEDDRTNNCSGGGENEANGSSGPCVLATWLVQLLIHSPPSEQQAAEQQLTIGKWLLRLVAETSLKGAQSDVTSNNNDNNNNNNVLHRHRILTGCSGDTDANIIICLATAATAATTTATDISKGTSTAILTPGDIGKAAAAAVFSSSSSSSSSSDRSDTKQLVIAAMRSWFLHVASSRKIDSERNEKVRVAYLVRLFSSLLEGGIFVPPGNPLIVAALSSSSSSSSTASSSALLIQDALVAAIEAVAVPKLRELTMLPDSTEKTAERGAADETTTKTTSPAVDRCTAALLKPAPSLHAAIAPLVSLRIVASTAAATRSVGITNLLKEIVHKYRRKRSSDCSDDVAEQETDSSSDAFWCYGEFRRLLAEITARVLSIGDCFAALSAHAEDGECGNTLSADTSHLRFLLLLGCETIMLHSSSGAAAHTNDDARHYLWQITQRLVAAATRFEAMTSTAAAATAGTSTTELIDDWKKLQQASIESQIVAVMGALTTGKVAEWWSEHAADDSTSATKKRKNHCRSIAVACQRGMLVSTVSPAIIWETLGELVLAECERTAARVNDISGNSSEMGDLLLALMFLCSTCLNNTQAKTTVTTGSGGAAAAATSSPPPAQVPVKRIAAVAAHVLLLHRQHIKSTAAAAAAYGCFSALKVIGYLATKSGAEALAAELGSTTLHEVKEAISAFVASCDGNDTTMKEAVELGTQLALLLRDF